jgi:transcriptional regulator with XRE-family HTH domain
MLLRNALGETLRDARNRQNRTLRDVSTAANVSLGYLSEVERGRKEASSELLASICDALDLELADLLDSVSAAMRTELVPADKSGVVTNSVKAGLGSSNRPRLGGMEKTHIDPTLRIIVPYGSTRPGAPVG